MASSSGSSDGTSKSGQAFGWGFLSAFSLILGAFIGVVKLPSKVVRAAFMAFGGGALIEALSVELFAHIMATAKGDHAEVTCKLDDSGRPVVHHESQGDVWLVPIAVGCAFGGGLLFAGLDLFLSNHGAAVRKAATVRAYVGRLRYALLRRLITRLRHVPMFEVLSEDELSKLAKSMVKERFTPGQVIFQELGNHSPIFFVMAGEVELSLTHSYETNDGSAPEGSSSARSLSAREDGSATKEHVVDIFHVGPNDLFGEMAMFTSETLQAKATALSACVLLRIPSSALHRLLASNRRLQDFVTMTAVERLRETDAFSRCTPSTVARLVTFMKQAEFDTGDVLFYDIDAFCPIYLVVLGRVELSLDDTSSGESPLLMKGEAKRKHVISSNGLLGAEHLLLGKGVHATARALEPTTVLIVQRSDIDKLCEKDARFKQALIASAMGGAEHADGAEGAVPLVPPEGIVGPEHFHVDFEALGWERVSEQAAVTTIVSRPSSNDSFKREVSQDDTIAGALDDTCIIDNVTELPDLLAAEAAARHPNDKHQANHHDHEGSAQAAIMIWMGILIDSVPESVVMGIMVNTSEFGTLLAFVVGVFLANMPEAMSSAGTMAIHGMSKRVIMFMWTSITVCTAIGACLGAVIFPPGSKENPDTVRIIACIEGMCGGAMLTMIANTVLPEAFEQGGNVTGLSCLSGFLVALLVSNFGSYIG